VPYDEYRDPSSESGIRIAETPGGNLGPHLPALEAAGVKVIHKVVSVRHAVKG
jgi:NADH:quinone reductase (non-electrogenic)